MTTWLITGCLMGLGRSLAQAVLEAGFNAVVTARNPSSIAYLATQYPRTPVTAPPEARKANLTLVDVIKEVGKRKGATPAQVALAWLLRQKTWIAPIPATTELPRLLENLEGAELDLTESEVSSINASASKIKVQGERLPDAALK